MVFYAGWRSFRKRLSPLARGRRPRSRPRVCPRRPRLEPLEARWLPTISGSFTAPFAASVGAIVNVSKMLDNQEETTIAVDPTNPGRLFAASNLDGVNDTGVAANGLFTATSTDGGATWTTRVQFSAAGATQACCDPEAVFDNFGNLFLTYISNNFDVIVATSTDGGRTFTTTQLTANGSNDQPKIAVGPSGTPGQGSVWVAYTDSANALAVQGARVTGLGQVGAFSTPEEATGSRATTGDFGGLAVGPGGQVFVTYQTLTTTAGPDTIYGNLDPDGLGAQGFGPQIVVTNTNVGGARLIPTTSNNFGIDAEAQIAWDVSGGAHNGRLYLAYTDAANTTTNDTNIFVRHSDDNGTTWSSRLRVNDDSTAFSQFNDSINVDQSTGNVGVAWYDARNDPGSGPGDTDGKPDTDAEQYAAVSTDGGATFAPNIQLTSHPSNAADSEPPATGLRPLGYGDYNRSTFADGTFYRLWADNSNSTGDNPDRAYSKLDLYTDRVTVGGETVSLAGGAGNDTYVIKLDPTGQFVDFYENTAPSGLPTFIAAKGSLSNNRR